jgi:hypothetical protein
VAFWCSLFKTCCVFLENKIKRISRVDGLCLDQVAVENMRSATDDVGSGIMSIYFLRRNGVSLFHYKLAVASQFGKFDVPVGCMLPDSTMLDHVVYPKISPAMSSIERMDERAPFLANSKPSF